MKRLTVILTAFVAVPILAAPRPAEAWVWFFSRAIVQVANPVKPVKVVKPSPKRVFPKKLKIRDKRLLREKDRRLRNW